MTIFQTERLLVRTFKKDDSDDYFDMMGNPNVMNPIPRDVMTREESNDHLNKFINTEHTTSDKKVWAIELKSENKFIGLCAFLKNNENEDEIGYRLREKYWKKGYGTEVTIGLLKYGFERMKMDKITADVNTRNLNTVKILEKFMTTKKEFFNASDNCTDRRYEITKNNWCNNGNKKLLVIAHSENSVGIFCSGCTCNVKRLSMLLFITGTDRCNPAKKIA